MSIDVLRPGLLTTVQDLGRWGYVRLGVLSCGAMDPFALMAANLLVGNEPGRGGGKPGAAGLEITVSGPTLLFREPCLMAVTGGDLRPRIDGREVEGWRAHLVRAGQVLDFAGRRSGARAYLAIAGGIAVGPWLGSRSTCLAASAGGMEGRALRAGDRLPIGRPSAPLSGFFGRSIPPEFRPAYSTEPTLRVILGPHLAWFAEEGIETFLSNPYQITADSNRMAYRLEGPKIAHNRGADASSCGIPPAGVQVPGIGQPILFMADKPLGGGYPQIAAVIQADIPLAAQCLPGDRLRFRAVGLEEARDSYQRLMAWLQRAVAETETVF